MERSERQKLTDALEALVVASLLVVPSIIAILMTGV